MLAQPLPIAQIWNWIRVLVSNFFSLNHITKCFCLRQIKLHVGSEYQEVQTMKLHFQLYGQGRVRRNGVSDPSIGEADSFWLNCFCPRSSLCPRFPSLHPLPSWCWFVAPGICWNTWYKRYCCLSGTLLLVEVTSCGRTNWVVLSRAAEGSCFLDVLSFEHFLGFVCGGFCLFLLFFWLLFSNQIFLDSDLLTEGIGQLCFSSDVLVLQVCLQDVSVCWWNVALVDTWVFLFMLLLDGQLSINPCFFPPFSSFGMMVTWQSTLRSLGENHNKTPPT